MLSGKNLKGSLEKWTYTVALTCLAVLSNVVFTTFALERVDSVETGPAIQTRRTLTFVDVFEKK